MRLHHLCLIAIISTARAADVSQPISGQLLDPDGKPVSGVAVCLCARRLDVYDARFPGSDLTPKQVADRPKGQGEIWLVSTDADGNFSFPAPNKNYMLLATTDSGYVIAKANHLDLPAKLQLTQWAKIHGVVTRGQTGAAVGISISVGYRAPNAMHDEIGPDIQARNVPTDAHGEFVIDRAFAGSYTIDRRTGAAVNVNAPAGETTETVLRLMGRPVIGQIARPAAVRDRHDWILPPSGFDRDVQLPSVSLPPDFLRQSQEQRQAWFEQWKQSPEGQKTLREREFSNQRRTVDFEKARSFRLDDLEPGTYTLPAFFYQGSISENHELANVNYRFTVPPIPGGFSDEPLDVGTLEPQPQGQANVGQLAPDFPFKTLDGVEHTLGEFKGKVILLEFWGTWCGGCVMDMPHVKEIHDTFGKDENFVMISFSARDKVEKLQPFIQQHEMTWPQVSLGDDKDAWPLILYGISGYPSYWLVDRNGKIAYHDWRLDDLKAAIAKTLAHSGEENRK